MNETLRSENPDTYFAPAVRSDPIKLEEQVSACLENPIARVVLESVDSYALILNENRQILAANPKLLDSLRTTDPTCFQGLRPGEVFKCDHVSEGPDGCGTSKACVRCGAVLSILASQALGESVTKECYLDRHVDTHWEPCDFRVRATPLQVGSHRFTVFVLQNITSEKRAKLLEGIFLHDLLNSLQGLRGWTEILQQRIEDPMKAAERILQLSDHLTQEVIQQQMVLQAERGELAANPTLQNVRDVFQELEYKISGHTCSQDRQVVFRQESLEDELFVDPLVLHRVLSNMLINALEATQPEGTVTVWYERINGSPSFFVHNPMVIPEVIRPRIFQRFCSTKNSGSHGFGTYSMKLLGENILEGQVGFTSTREAGTCFHLILPKEA